MAGGHDIHDPNTFVLYRYHPSLAAAAVFAVLFAISSLLHTYQVSRKRSWFMIPFLIGVLFEVLGYVGRIISSHNQFSLAPYIMQSLLLLLAPALFAASIYMVLGRVINLTDGEEYSVIRRTWLTKIFVGGDILSFLTQSAGGGILSNAGSNHHKINLGQHIILAGLLIQIIFFGFFVAVALIFQRRGRAHLRKVAHEVPWKKHLLMLYVTSACILVRNIFKVIEYIQGNAGFLLRHEIFLYVFDAALMLTVVVLVNVIHPGDIAKLLKEKMELSGAIELNRPNLKGHTEGSEPQQPYV